MIDIKNEMAKRVDHPIPYLVDLVGRLVKERDFAVELGVKYLHEWVEKTGGEDTLDEVKKWFINKLDELIKEKTNGKEK